MDILELKNAVSEITTSLGLTAVQTQEKRGLVNSKTSQWQIPILKHRRKKEWKEQNNAEEICRTWSKF